MSIAKSIISATEEVFRSYVSLGATSGEPFERGCDRSDHNVTSIVQFNGTVNGYLAVDMPRQTANLVTSALFFIEENDLQESDINDAIGELANILAGHVKAFIDPEGGHVKLSLPQLLTHLDSPPPHTETQRKVTIPFYMDDGDFCVDLVV